MKSSLVIALLVLGLGSHYALCDTPPTAPKTTPPAAAPVATPTPAPAPATPAATPTSAAPAPAATPVTPAAPPATPAPSAATATATHTAVDPTKDPKLPFISQIFALRKTPDTLDVRIEGALLNAMPRLQATYGAKAAQDVATMYRSFIPEIKQKLLSDLVDFYEANFTESELREIAIFLNTPAGRKFTNIAPVKGLQNANAPEEYLRKSENRTIYKKDIPAAPAAKKAAAPAAHK